MINCLMCVHCVFDYDGPWSEYTPGEGAITVCNKDHWHVGLDDGKQPFFKAIGKAGTCPDYEKETWA